MTLSPEARAALLGLGGFTALTLSLAVAQNSSGSSSSSNSSGSKAKLPFSTSQAKSGQKVYGANCQSCHGQNLGGGQGPALKGSAFLSQYGGKPISNLYTYISKNMPLGNVGSLSKQQYLDVTAYLLSQNGFQPSGKALTEKNASATLGSGNSGSGGGQQTQVPSTLPQPPQSVQQAVSKMPTQAMLTNAAEGDDWLMYNKDYQGQRYSGLKQINTNNAGQLQKVCEFTTGEKGSFEPGILELGGFLYFTTPHNTYSVNATNCNREWTSKYTPGTAEPFPTNRGAAMLGGKLFRGTTDGHLLALDKNNGNVLWDVWVANSNQGYWLPSAPIVWNGMVFVGEAGADWGVKGHVYAFGADDGKLMWTFDVIPTAQEQGADTWDKATTAAHGGGSMWTSYALDPDSGLLYVPVGNPAPDFAGDYRPGKNLFTNSVLVLGARDGQLAWYVQQIAGDFHDYDTAAAPVLYSAGGNKYMAVANKGGHLYMYDRATHDEMHKVPVTTIKNADKPLTTEGTYFCPGTSGGVEWNGPAYDAPANTLYVNSVDWCTTIKLGNVRYQAGNIYTGTANGFGDFPPKSQANGWTYAVDATSGDVRWKREAGSPMVAGVTPTAGGVVFTGDLNGNFLALSAQDGSVLYKDNLGAALAGGVITYQLGGRQYVAMTSGNNSRTWQTQGQEKITVYALPQGQ